MTGRPAKRRRLGPTELSPSELAVLHLLANGRDPYDLAAELGLTRNTVQVHRNRAYRKLGAVDLTSAVLTALQVGLMRPDAIVTGPLRRLAVLASAPAKLAAVQDWAATTRHSEAAAEIHRILGTPHDRRTRHDGTHPVRQAG